MRKYNKPGGGPKFDVWRVSHEECGQIEIVAISDESAILNACKTWGLNWGHHAIECTALKIEPAQKLRCRFCGREEYVGKDHVCNLCRQSIAEQRRAIRSRRDAKNRQWA